jgi:hypothetical protein
VERVEGSVGSMVGEATTKANAGILRCAQNDNFQVMMIFWVVISFLVGDQFYGGDESCWR